VKPDPVSKAGFVLAAAVIVAFALDGALHQALAASNPFGAPRGAADVVSHGGVLGWLMAKQSQFYGQLSSAIRAAKSDGTAVWTLLLLSFAYGIFHAAGPGHGKAVISSYLVANRETVRRGIVLSLASAMLQALVAVLVVTVLAWALNATARTMCGTEKVIEIASYALIGLLGARLVWSKGRALIAALKAPERERPGPDRERPGPDQGGDVADACGHQHHHHHDHHHDHDHDHNGGGEKASGQEAHVHEGHGHDGNCCHGPEPADLAGPGGWRRGAMAVLTVGIRPCSGAILVLVFALAQGLMWAGIAAVFVMGLGTAIAVATIATLAVSARSIAERLASGRAQRGTLLIRAVELGAAALVLLFGVGLLFGFLAAERTTCF